MWVAEGAVLWDAVELESEPDILPPTLKATLQPPIKGSCAFIPIFSTKEAAEAWSEGRYAIRKVRKKEAPE
jgi:hypothetical protein